jgi:hypothetical protein
VVTGGRRGASHARIEEDIRREKAAALGRAGERLDAALAEVRDAVRRLDHAADATVRRRLFEDYERAWRRARLAREALLVQREAIGLRHHGAVDQAFPEPPVRRRTS